MAHFHGSYLYWKSELNELSPFIPQKISILVDLILRHLSYLLINVSS